MTRWVNVDSESVDSMYMAYQKRKESEKGGSDSVRRAM